MKMQPVLILVKLFPQYIYIYIFAFNIIFIQNINLAENQIIMKYDQIIFGNKKSFWFIKNINLKSEKIQGQKFGLKPNLI